MKENHVYHPETAEYLGAIPFSGNPGALPPRFSTPKCPHPPPGHASFWDEEKDDWEYLRDFRGVTAYSKTSGAAVILNCLESIPDEYTLKPPPACAAGFAARWNEEADDWEEAENHIGEIGYVAGEQITITELGPRPKGWMTEPPTQEPEPVDPVEARKAEIHRELNGVDRATIRPLRAVLAKAAGSDDEALLVKLEERAAELRAELASLIA